MKGFDPQFNDLTDYIIKITEEIWEGRAIGAINRYYDKRAARHTPYGDQVGVEMIIQDTLQLLDVFPDRQLLPQDVIGHQHKNDYHSSHRIIAVMHQRGQGIYDSPSGQLIQTHAIADCAVRANRIYEEWELHDYKGLVLQMGYDPQTFVKDKLLPRLTPPSGYRQTKPNKAAKRRKGIGYMNEADSAEAHDYVILLHKVWQDRDLSFLREYYHPGCTLFLPGGECRYGQAAMDAFLMSYLAAFHPIELSIDKVTTNKELGKPTRVAVRWTLKAIHSGPGRFGSPTMAQVEMMAISHLHFYDGRIIAEWLLIDELAIWLQTLLHTQRQSPTDTEPG